MALDFGIDVLPDEALMTNKEIVTAAKKQLGIDLNCRADAFDSDSSSVVEAGQNSGRRLFSEKESFFEMASFGSGAVLSANLKIKAFCERFAGSETGIRLFEPPKLRELERELDSNGYSLGEFYDSYLPDIDRIPKSERGDGIALVEQDEIPELFKYKGFGNALQYSAECLRPDVLAAIMFEGRVMCGIAAASRDSAMLWQVGVDVIPSMRKKGVGSALVGVLTSEILNREIVPYYGTWSANIASRRTALNCGYVPAWVGVYSAQFQSQDIERDN